MSIDKRNNGKVNSRGIAVRGEKSAYEHELDVDKVGFAFGGIDQGQISNRSRERGRYPEKHKVSYSVGRAGTYRLHVRLRKEGLAIPGSPFDLRVLPGTAEAAMCALQSGPEPVGRAGLRYRALLATYDIVGNSCGEELLASTIFGVWPPTNQVSAHAHLPACPPALMGTCPSAHLFVCPRYLQAVICRRPKWFARPLPRMRCRYPCQ